MGTHFKKNWLWYTIIILLLIGNLYFFATKKWSEREAKIRHDELEIECSDRITTVTEQNYVEYLKRQSDFFTTYLSPELEDKSHRDLREKMREIVAKTRVTAIEFVSPEGEIHTATDRRTEGDPVDEDFPSILFSNDEVIHTHQIDQGYLISVPVYQRSNYQGRLLVYHSELNSNIGPQK